MKNKNLISVITASSVGTMIEWYNFYIFGSLATIISTQFFPKENPTAAFLATLATYAAGLVARPFGALFFGRLGDLINAGEYYLTGLNYPLVLMGITLLIGVLYLKEKSEVKSFISISAKKLNTMKRYAGIVWIMLGLAAAWLGIFKLGIPKLASGNRDDLIFGIIVLFIITPVASIGLFFFGKYALQGEYDDKLISDAIHAENNLLAVK